MVVCKDDCGVTAPTEKACAHFCEGAKKRCNARPGTKSKCPKTCEVCVEAPRPPPPPDYGAAADGRRRLRRPGAAVAAASTAVAFVAAAAGSTFRLALPADAAAQSRRGHCRHPHVGGRRRGEPRPGDVWCRRDVGVTLVLLAIMRFFIKRGVAASLGGVATSLRARRRGSRRLEAQGVEIKGNKVERRGQRRRRRRERRRRKQRG